MTNGRCRNRAMARGRSIVVNWLLAFIPVTVALEHWAPERYLLVFFAAAVAILPLAGWLGRATEQLAERMGEGVGGLLNATFGNAGRADHRARRPARRPPRRGEGLDRRIDCRQHPAGARRRHAGGRAAAPGTAIQRSGGELAGDDADAGRDRAGPPRRLSQPARRARRWRESAR